LAYSQHITSAADIVARCAIVTLSDTRTAESDKSGQLIRTLVEQHGHRVAGYSILPDDPEQLGGHLDGLLGNDEIDAILTNGGTGISARDQTIPIIQSRLETELPGFGEIFRMLSYEEIQSGAMLSRAIGGIRRGKLLFAMPGSSKAVELAMTKLILPELRHLLFELRKS
jgi:molybdenum cofactor biosynthesis protein B